MGWGELSCLSIKYQTLNTSFGSHFTATFPNSLLILLLSTSYWTIDPLSLLNYLHLTILHRQCPFQYHEHLPCCQTQWALYCHLLCLPLSTSQTGLLVISWTQLSTKDVPSLCYVPGTVLCVLYIYESSSEWLVIVHSFIQSRNI